MKKVFCVIAVIIIASIGSFVIWLSVKESKITSFENPSDICIYYKSSVSIHNTQYTSKDEEYNKIMEYLDETLTSSYITLLLKEKTLNVKPIYGADNYAKYDEGWKLNNLVIELNYTQTKEIICYENGNTRVIPYCCVILVIPCVENFDEIICYTSLTRSNEKIEHYKSSKPFILKGNPKSLLKYVQELQGQSN